MKLSHLTLSALLLAASVSYAQQEPKRPKSDTTKVQRKRPETGKKAVTKKDTLKGTLPSHKIINPDYCPPCGMG